MRPESPPLELLPLELLPLEPLPLEPLALEPLALEPPPLITIRATKQKRMKCTSEVERVAAPR